MQRESIGTLAEESPVINKPQLLQIRANIQLPQQIPGSKVPLLQQTLTPCGKQGVCLRPTVDAQHGCRMGLETVEEVTVLLIPSLDLSVLVSSIEGVLWNTAPGAGEGGAAG